MRVYLILSVVIVALWSSVGHSVEPLPYSIDQLAKAIYKAEGSEHTLHPYGILKHYKHTSARQACINTINHALRDWNCKGDFIAFLGSRYCPVGCSNDRGTNKYWVRNVRHLIGADTLKPRNEKNEKQKQKKDG